MNDWIMFDPGTLDASQLARLYSLLRRIGLSGSAEQCENAGVVNCGARDWKLEVIHSEMIEDHIEATYR